MAQPGVNTKTCPHRELTLRSLDELSAELDRIERAEARGALRHTGNWPAGRVLEHLAIMWRCTLDGFPEGAKAPWPVRAIAKLLFKRRAVSGARPPRGIKLPAQASFLLPPEQVTFADGMASVRRCIERVANGDRMTHASPLFGRLTHEQWLNIHLSHCAMHLGYLDPGV